MKTMIHVAIFTLAATAFSGCMMEEGEFEIGSTEQLISGPDFKGWYCNDTHKFLYCGTEQTGRTVVKNRSSDIWVYATPDDGSITVELAEKIDGVWVTTHTDTVEPGWVGRAYTFAEEKMRRARIVRAHGDVYHVSVFGE